MHFFFLFNKNCQVAYYTYKFVNGVYRWQSAACEDETKALGSSGCLFSETMFLKGIGVGLCILNLQVNASPAFCLKRSQCHPPDQREKSIERRRKRERQRRVWVMMSVWKVTSFSCYKLMKNIVASFFHEWVHQSTSS